MTASVVCNSLPQLALAADAPVLLPQLLCLELGLGAVQLDVADVLLRSLASVQ